MTLNKTTNGENMNSFKHVWIPLLLAAGTWQSCFGADIVSGLWCDWEFRDGSGATTAYDSTGNSHTLSLHNSYSWETAHNGGGISFDGSSSYGTVDADFSGTPAITIAGWFRVPSNPPDHLWFELSDNFTSYADAFAVSPVGTGQAINVALKGSLTNSYSTLNPTSGPAAGEWHHLAFVLDRSIHFNEVNEYLDSVALSGSRTYNTDNTGANFGHRTLYLASRPSASLYSQVEMQGVRIYTRALSADDIALLYAHTLGYPRSGAANAGAATNSISRGGIVNAN